MNQFIKRIVVIQLKMFELLLLLTKPYTRIKLLR